MPPSCQVFFSKSPYPGVTSVPSSREPPRCVLGPSLGHSSWLPPPAPSVIPTNSLGTPCCFACLESPGSGRGGCTRAPASLPPTSLPRSYEQVTNEDLLTNCTLLLCRRLLEPMNLLSLQTASGLRLFSVLSLSWGFIADVDLESEKFRRLGELRFTLGTFLRLAALRVYRGRLAYLPAGRGVPGVPASPAVDRQDQQGPTDAHLVPLEEPVPAHWTVVPEQDFVLVLALLHSHLGSEMFAAPMGRSAAGTMHLFYVRAGVSRATLLRLFLAMEKGKHLEQACPYLVYAPVVAFRLEPKDGKGVFAADGELLVSEAVQGQVHADYIWMVSGCVEPPPGQKPRRGSPPEKPL